MMITIETIESNYFGGICNMKNEEGEFLKKFETER